VDLAAPEPDGQPEVTTQCRQSSLVEAAPNVRAKRSASEGLGLAFQVPRERAATALASTACRRGRYSELAIQRDWGTSF
jgi:hypothetical protein